MATTSPPRTATRPSAARAAPHPGPGVAGRLGWLAGGPLPGRLARWDTPATTYYVLQGAVALLVLVGLVMVLSSSFVESFDEGGSSFRLAVKQTAFAALGALGMVVVSRVPIAWWRPVLPLPALALVVACGLQVLVFTPLGIEVGGNTNWIGVGGMTVQPSELIKVALVLWCAAVLTHQRRRLHHLPSAVVPLAVGAAPAVGLVLLGRDLGTSLVLAMVVAAALFVAGLPVRHLVALAVPALVLLVVLASTSNRLGRIASFAAGHTDTQGAGWQPVHGLYALASGGLTGVGLGASREKWSWLPAAHNDYIFAIIGEELGLLGALTVLALFAVLAWSCARVVRASDDLFVKVLTCSVMAWVLGQAAVNIAVVTGMAPVVGVPLPLISYGGSALISTMLAMGLVLACVRSLPGASRALAGHPGLVRRSLAVVPGVRVADRAARAARAARSTSRDPRTPGRER